MKNKMKRILALALAVLVLAALLAACRKQGGDTTTTRPEDAASQGPSGAEGSTAAGKTDENGQPITAESTAGSSKEDEADEGRGGNYSSENRIPTKKEGKDYSNGKIPSGVAEIFSMDGKLLFTYVTRLVGHSDTKTNNDYYTLFQYHPLTGRCSAVSPEVGYIMRVGDRFLYDKEGVGIGAENYWDVPYYTNNSSWTDEKQITGEQARKLLSAPQSALINGKIQPYTMQRNGLVLTVTLPESDDVLTCTLDPRGVFGSKTLDGYIVDLRGMANDKMYVSISYAPEDGGFRKELCSVKLSDGVLTPIRYGNTSIWVDPRSELRQDGIIYGYAILENKDRALLRIDTAKDSVQLLATIKDSAYHCVATDDYVLYEIPKDSGKNELECKKIAAS